MKRKTVKLKITCRMCAKSFVNNKPLLLLYQKYKHLKEFPINIMQKYNIADFKVFKNDGLPQQICVKCLEKFISINEFIENCLNIQNQLRTEFPYIKLHTYKNENANEPRNVKEEVVHKLNKIKIKDILSTNVLEEAQIKVSVKEEQIKIKNEDPIKTENYEETLNVDKKENNFEIVLMDIPSEISENINSNCNIDDGYDNNISDEEYFNDNFQEDYTLNCQFCETVFNNIKDLDAHEMKKHKTKLYNKYLICEHCGESVRNYRFSEHVKIIHECKKLYNCEDCGKDFKKFRAFKEHSIKYHQSDQNQIIYDDKEKFPCTECNRVYLKLGILNNHIKNVHSSTLGLLKKSNQQTSLTTPTTFQCDICKIKFRNIVSMEKHRTNHVNEKYAHKFECPECDRRFGRRDHLKYHMKLVHLKDKPHKCEICDKSYVIGFQLNTHMKLVHSNDKTARRARCDNCNKTFYNSRYLLRHQKEVHSFDAQFVCVICNEKFFKHVHLIKHAQIHNIEKSLTSTTENIANDDGNSKEHSMKEIIEYVEPKNIDKINDNIEENDIEMAVSILIKTDDEIEFIIPNKL